MRPWEKDRVVGRAAEGPVALRVDGRATPCGSMWKLMVQSCLPSMRSTHSSTVPQALARGETLSPHASRNLMSLTQSASWLELRRCRHLIVALENWRFGLAPWTSRTLPVGRFFRHAGEACLGMSAYAAEHFNTCVLARAASLPTSNCRVGKMAIRARTMDVQNFAGWEVFSACWRSVPGHVSLRCRALQHLRGLVALLV